MHHHTIQQIANQLFSYAKDRSWSLTRLCREYPGLGSERTFRDMRDGKGDKYDLDNWLIAYQAALTAIIDVTETPAEQRYYDNLSTVMQVHRAILGAMNNTGNNRVVIIQGDTGIGKTYAADILAKRYGERIIRIEATTVWNDRPKALLDAILHVLGQTPPSVPVAALSDVVHHLSGARRCLIIDEAHHMGPRCLDTVKTLVNRTRGEFVLMAMATLWDRLGTRAYFEARQIGTNRLSERVVLELTLGDIVQYLANALPSQLSDDDLATAARLLLPPSIQSGNFAFVRDVTDLLADVSPVDRASIADAIDDIKARR